MIAVAAFKPEIAGIVLIGRADQTPFAEEVQLTTRSRAIPRAVGGLLNNDGIVEAQSEAEAVRTRASARWGTCMTGGPALLRGELQLRPH